MVRVTFVDLAGLRCTVTGPAGSSAWAGMLIFSERQPRHVLAEYESHHKTPGRIERWNGWRPSSASSSLATATGRRADRDPGPSNFRDLRCCCQAASRLMGGVCQGRSGRVECGSG
jgi:hypothetical protein